MNSLTLKCTITQLRCRFLPFGIQYEAMINNHWQPVTHKFVEILWSILIKQQRELVKNNSLSYSDVALAKSSVRIGTLQLPMATHDAQSVFFCVNARVHLYFISMVALVGHPKGWLFSVGSSSSNPVNVTANEIGTSCGDYNNYPTEAVSMTTIPNEIVPRKAISITQIDTINKKLLQVEAIIHLLSVNSSAEIQINDNLVCDVLWAVSDLVADARQCLHHTPNVEVPA